MSYYRDGDEPPEFRGKSLDLAGTYRTQMAQCLVLADYTKPHKYVIETLVFHLHSEYARSNQAEVSVWVLVGMIARLAMRMGYHRDSKMYPNITPFEGEMRRRIWSFVRQADILFSYQIGLPSMIRIGDSDTELPRNIYDDEIDEDCKELPPARPQSEATPISYMITKARLAFAFGRVLEHVQGIQHCPYEEVMKIDNSLREVRDSLPEHLKVRPLQDSNLDPATLITSRINVCHSCTLSFPKPADMPSSSSPPFTTKPSASYTATILAAPTQTLAIPTPVARVSIHPWSSSNTKPCFTKRPALMAVCALCDGTCLPLPPTTSSSPPQSSVWTSTIAAPTPCHTGAARTTSTPGASTDRKRCSPLSSGRGISGSS